MAPLPRKLPSAERAIVDATKITEYLLNASHPDNGGKARFFESLGFSAVAPMLLAGALRALATSGEVVQESRRRRRPSWRGGRVPHAACAA
jgi:Domain of unknown function (DUF6883)